MVLPRILPELAKWLTDIYGIKQLTMKLHLSYVVNLF